MGKYFGTDGVRGIANKELTAELAYKIGRCGGYVLAGQVEKPTVVIGRDTRISGSMLEAALVAGLLSIGANVVRLGVVSTPGVAYLTRLMKADAGVMISASHNPVEDNGIKFFGGDGFKLSDDTELEIERLMDAEADELPRPTGGDLGTATDDDQAKFKYLEYVKASVKSSFKGFKIVLDCAHGAAYELAPKVFEELGAEVITIGAEPNGRNINDHCGSTHPEALQKAVVEHKAVLGLAFDGDADRLIAIDDTGAEVDGDFLLSICGYAMNQAGLLKHSTIVTTVMSNIGFFKGIEAVGLKAAKTAVGDRYVMEEMRKGGYNLGGEQSGHVIFLDYNTTGDGILTGLQLMDTLVQAGKPLSELKQIMRKYPQKLVNVRVADKSKWKDNPTIENAIRKVEQELGDNGRVLVRPSGTESLIRVMAEGPDRAQVEAYVQDIADIIERELS
ncbi:phosphoglucosamine mutase [Paenibacillus radicis (ex Xue et al. 2023)]|uniref:Phosphoglucosamine mutase n=1 Tax=Paenibacillus radicis (ex Xue et al. 2023) TaxID=2972489 RepID=A0ABT1YUW2_9BACL|nr:phosphoglucosamine mutase [Paenibacillus radicis (ex Xue et al. 2023)]MCR8636630.1 phosphoglucosamine mutase [Paenibacillus radicis (ex Xue et al. 2023)]